MTKTDGMFWLLFCLSAATFTVIRWRMARRVARIKAVVRNIRPGID